MHRIVCVAFLSTLSAAAFAQEARTLTTRGDFDGDGRPDTATLTVGTERYRLVAQLSTQPREVVIEEGNRRYAGDTLETLPPQTYTPS